MPNTASASVKRLCSIAFMGEPCPTKTEETIAYPVDMARIRSEDNPRAKQIQKENAEKFQSAFARGLAVTGFERRDNEGVYLLEPYQ